MPTRKTRLAKSKNNHWYIEFYATNPDTGEDQRFRRTFGLNRIEDLHDRETEARKILKQLPHKIKHGFPFVNVELRRQWHQALPYALSFKMRSDRYKTRVTYSSQIGIFEKYLRAKKLWHSNINDFTRVQAIEFLDHIEAERELAPTTVNNYRMTLRAVLNELVRREILENNPFSLIEKRKETEKIRRALTDYEKKAIISYAVDHDKTLLLAISLVYYTFIRPVELRRMKVKYIDLQKGIITMPGKITKNKETSHLTIPDQLTKILSSFNIQEWDGEDYIFGAGMKPAPKKCGHHSISRRHLRACKVLKNEKVLNNTEGIQLYSWKDTGAMDYVSLGIPMNELMEHLRHKDLSTTQQYLNSFAEVNENIKTKAKRLI